jgi:hypothetical protein
MKVTAKKRKQQQQKQQQSQKQQICDTRPREAKYDEHTLVSTANSTTNRAFESSRQSLCPPKMILS